MRPLRLIIGSIGTLVVALGFGFSAADAANYKYTYTGNNFTVANGCLTSSMHIAMTLILSKKLPPNATGKAITPKSWTATNGLHAFNSNSPNAASSVGFYTDKDGTITAWNVSLGYVISRPKGQYPRSASTTAVGGVARDEGIDYTCNPTGESFAPPSTWTQP